METLHSIAHLLHICAIRFCNDPATNSKRSVRVEFLLQRKIKQANNKMVKKQKQTKTATKLNKTLAILSPR